MSRSSQDSYEGGSDHFDDGFEWTFVMTPDGFTPWLVREDRPIRDNMMLEVRMGNGEWILVRAAVHSVVGGHDVEFYLPMHGTDDPAIASVPYEAEIRSVGREGAARVQSD